MRLSDSVYEAIKNYIPQRKNTVGRPLKSTRDALDGIFYVLKTGCQWNCLPHQYGNYKTVHRKFMQWAKRGIFSEIMTACQKNYTRQQRKNNWYVIDTSSKRSPFANFSGKNSTDRGKRGVKFILVADRNGAPFFADIEPANRHDSQLVNKAIDALGYSKQTRILAADSAYDSEKIYKQCSRNNIALHAAPNRRRDQNKIVFKVFHRWVVEQAFGKLSWLRSLKTCWSKTIESARSLLQFACSIMLLRMA